MLGTGWLRSVGGEGGGLAIARLLFFCIAFARFGHSFDNVSTGFCAGLSNRGQTAGLGIAPD